jgi:hypothetical protein
MTDTNLQQVNQQMLSNRLIRSAYQNQTVHDTVESWNWNMNIFEIYDEIKEWTESDQRNVLRYAYTYFNKDVMIDELASHLTGEGVKDL